jgi:hypothetical protein
VGNGESQFRTGNEMWRRRGFEGKPAAAAPRLESSFFSEFLMVVIGRVFVIIRLNVDNGYYTTLSVVLLACPYDMD